MVLAGNEELHMNLGCRWEVENRAWWDMRV